MKKTGFGGFGGYGGFEAKPLNLPKAPRAACESIIDESTVPQEGPFLVHMSNLQFEIDEDDITNYFKGLKVFFFLFFFDTHFNRNITSYEK